LLKNWWIFEPFMILSEMMQRKYITFSNLLSILNNFKNNNCQIETTDFLQIKKLKNQLATEVQNLSNQYIKEEAIIATILNPR
jgi:hypothetical protein